MLCTRGSSQNWQLQHAQKPQPCSCLLAGIQSGITLQLTTPAPSFEHFAERLLMTYLHAWLHKLQIEQHWGLRF